MHQLTAVLHIFEAITFGTYFLPWTAVLAGIGEILGWAGRLWSSLNDGTLVVPFLMQ